MNTLSPTQAEVLKTASDAINRAERVISRWRRLYGAWVVLESRKSEALLNG